MCTCSAMKILSSESLSSGGTLAVFCIISLAIFIKFQWEQPTPYMDEVCHIPQVQLFCKGIFEEWDKRITTPPGLYLSSLVLLLPFSKVLGNQFCQPWTLRLTNSIFSVGSAILFYLITKKLHSTMSAAKVTLSALNMSLLPVLYFFNFFYYTEPGSTFFVFLAYYHRLRHREGYASLFGCISLFFRQTNIVWVFFMACEKALEVLESELPLAKKMDDVISKCDFNYVPKLLQTLFTLLRQQSKLPLHIIKSILLRCGYYICVGIAFVVFVYFNDGVVVGDRTGHQVTPHLAQFLYFLGFMLFFANPFLLTRDRIASCIKYSRSSLVSTLVWMGLITFLLIRFYYDHWYLTDERHLVVHVWRNVFRQDSVRFFLIPLYYYSGWCMLDAIRKKDALWKIVYVFCAALSVVLEELFELRYFMVPYLFFRLHLPVTSNSQLVKEQIVYTSINAVMFYLFFKPNYVADFDQAVRFMW